LLGSARARLGGLVWPVALWHRRVRMDPFRCHSKLYAEHSDTGGSECRYGRQPYIRHPGAGAFLVSVSCCGNMDCFPVACDQLVETGSGWFYVPTGNLFKREQVQPSQDHHCHVCLGRGREHRSICAFIVPNV
jgi:hypothetical protein